MRDRQILTDLWRVGVNAAGGYASVAAALRRVAMPVPAQIIAVGKAATPMAQAALDHFGSVPTLIVTKDGHADAAAPGARVIEAAHPVPNDASMRAGDALLDTVRRCARGDHLLMLVSGGASALAEVLNDGLTLDDLRVRTQELLASGADIHAINAMRRDLSQLKGGKLLAAFGGASVTTLAISDVQGDALGVIGSGIGAAPAGARFEFDAHIVASNAIARAAVVQAARLPVLTNTEDLYDDVTALAPRLAAALIASAPGLHVHGGEPTVILPDAPGLGGRNMMLALMLARAVSGVDGLTILVGGTDGSDGPTDAAGAVIDGRTWDASGARAIAGAAPYGWLDARGALIKPGPTGTNVMDLLIAVRGTVNA